MGLDINGIRLLLVAKNLGANYRNVVTIGRQGLHLSLEQLRRELTNFNIEFPSDLEFTGKDYSELFFPLLGSQDTQSIDCSDYESATIIHDMNIAIAEEFKGRFSVVVDAGTLEHVFNYPVALKNCMELLETDGYFISITPANNFLGHGFYQFSPELFFSVFMRKNGFELVKLMVCEDYEDAQWYEVSKPKGGIQGRVTLINSHPTYLMCIARRLDARCEPFDDPPQQSDYLETWNRSNLEKEPANLSKAKQSWLISKIRPILKSMPGVMVLVRIVRYLRTPSFPKRDYIPTNLAKYHNEDTGSKSIS